MDMKKRLELEKLYKITHEPILKETHLNDLIEKAKVAIRRSYGYSSHDDDGRAWIRSSVSSYGVNNFDIDVIVMEGSPVKGYILVNYGTSTVKAFDYCDKLLKTFCDENK